MLYEIRADRDVTAKGPEGSGTRRRTVKLPGGPMTLTLGALPIYLDTDVLPPEIAGDEHLVTKAVSADSLHPGVTVIELKSERVQEESVADPGTSGDTTDLKSERVQEESAAAPPDDVDKLKSERVQNPTAVEAINKKRR
jgi:hypothetical protein